MAFITIKNGKVGRNLRDKGFELLESYTANGNEYTKRYAVWCSASDIPPEGVGIDVTGILSVTATISEKDGKPYANISINKAKFDIAKFEKASRDNVAAELNDAPF